MNETWQALAREAGLAAEHMAIGATALGRANYAQHAYYGQAFFALTIGLERAAKLAFVVDHALENNGKFPSNGEVRKYGHDLSKLLEHADGIALRRGLSGSKERLPRSEIHGSIIAILSDFSTNITRYYNLDLITGSQGVSKQNDPMRVWFDRVMIPILGMYYKPRHQKRHEESAGMMHQLMSSNSMVMFHSESGDTLDSVYEASLQTAMTDFAKPYARMYTMQIIRFISCLLSELGYAAYRQPIDDIPHFSDFFRLFSGSDDYLKKRKTWSIYKL